MLRVFRNLGQYRFESPLKFWIARIAHSIALRYAQRERRLAGDAPATSVPEGAATDAPVREDEIETFDFEAACDDEAAAARLHAGIAQLAPVQRSLLTLYHMEELSIPDIAAVTSLPVGTIKSHLYRSRLRLRELLEAKMGDVL
jgi:RNA polymerase sigma-70 factor (ECF subfamily)